MRQSLNSNEITRKAGRFGGIDYIKITVFGFALTALWSSLHSIILPLRLLDFVPESQKYTYLGILTFGGLILAMVVQPIAGAISDRSGFRWGRRRPYIVLGATAAIIFLPGIALFGSYLAIFIIYCLLQISSNTAQGPYQAFIPDLIPQERRGLASGVKILLELTGGLALVRLIAYLMTGYFAGEGASLLWVALSVLIIVLLGAVVATVLTVKERPGAGAPKLPLLSTMYKSFRFDVRANRDFLWFLISRGLIGMPGVMLQTFALYLLKDYFGVANPVAATADLLIVVGVCLLAVVYPAGRLSDRVGRKPVVISSGLLGALGIVSLFFSQSYLQVMVSGAILGIANGGLLSSSWALAMDFAVKGEQARYLGLTNLAMAGGFALARLIGPVIDFFNNNISPGLGYQVMLLVCLICFVVGSLLLMKVKGRYQPRK